MRVVSHTETVHARARRDPRWQAAWKQLTADDVRGETSSSAYARRTEAARLLRLVEVEHAVRAGVRGQV